MPLTKLCVFAEKWGVGELCRRIYDRLAILDSGKGGAQSIVIRMLSPLVLESNQP